MLLYHTDLYRWAMYGFPKIVFTLSIIIIDSDYHSLLSNE